MAIHDIIAAVAEGESPRSAVLHEYEFSHPFPHGWKDSDASGSRIKILYNPNPGYKRHIVRVDTKSGSWSHTGPGGYDVKGVNDVHDYLNKLHTSVVREALLDPRDSDIRKAKAPKPVGPPPRVHAQPAPEPVREPRKDTIDPKLKQRAMDWNKYQSAHPEETPEEKMRKIKDTFAHHGFRQMGSPRPGVTSFAHPDHPTHIVHYLSGADRPEGSPDGSWYHHDNQMVAHNSGYDHESLDTHLGQHFGTGPEHHS